MSAKAWQFTKRGRLSQTIEQVQRPIPEPKDDEVVVKVQVVALNPVDEQLAQSSDRLLKFMGAPPMGTPWVPCDDYAGVIHKAGKDSGFSVGDEVHGYHLCGDANGTLQEYLCVAGSSAICRRPPSLSLEQAAAIPLVYLTVYTALIKYGKLPFNPPKSEQNKRSVLILGGSSGTGNVAIQLAKKMGLRVVTSCSGKNVDFVKSLGADEVIDYRTEDVRERALMSHYAPYAVVLDCVGGTDLLPSLEHLILHEPQNPQLGIYVTIVGDKTGRDAMGGAITNYYYPSQAIRAFRGSLNDTLPSWFPLKSLIAGKRYACIILEDSKDMLATVPEFLEHAKEIKIDSVWSFADAKKAFEKLESSRAVGKIVVTVP